MYISKSVFFIVKWSYLGQSYHVLYEMCDSVTHGDHKSHERYYLAIYTRKQKRTEQKKRKEEKGPLDF
jgi:hypothetical protein